MRRVSSNAGGGVFARCASALLALAAFAAPVRAQNEAPAPSPEVHASPAPRAPKPPILLGIAVDDLGITQRDLYRTRDFVATLVAALPPGSLVTVASFSHEPRVILTPTSDAALVRKTLSDYKAGETQAAFPDGLFDVVDYLAGVPAELRALVLVSGGQTRDGDLEFSDPLNAATSRDIPIFTLAYGQGDGKLLRRVARLTRGEYVRLEVADAPMLARALFPRLEPLPPTKVPVELIESIPKAESAKPASRFSVKLLVAAILLLSVGGFLLVGVIALVVKRSHGPAAPAPAPPARSPGAGRGPKMVLRSRPAGERHPLADGDEVLEATMVVNANPLLRALSGPGAGKNFPLLPTGITSVGRSRANTIVVPEEAASARHCRIDREGDSYVMHDLGSTNGTWVNGIRTERSILQHGDKLKIGETVFLVSLFGDRP